MISSWFKAIRHFIYPDYCMHCHDGIEDQRFFFCEGCLQLLDWIDLKSRCRYCFKILENPEFQIDCGTCGKQRNRFAAAMEYQGPAGTLLKEIKYGLRHDLSTIAAAKIVVQWERLDWPKPDLIIPIPSSRPAVKLIAEALGEILEVPARGLIRRRFLALPQHRLPTAQREQIQTDSFLVKYPAEICGKIVYLIDDVLTTGGTMRASCCVVEACFPTQIFGLAFCG